MGYGRGNKLYLCVTGTLLVMTLKKLLRLLLLMTLLMNTLPAHAQGQAYLHTDGSRIVDANGNPVLITGISWFGLETESFAPHGLWARSLGDMLDQIRDLGFNTIRLPYSNELLKPGSQPNGINYDLNPDLRGLSGLEIMDRVVAEAGRRGLKIILDRHRPDSHAQSELWYTPTVSEEQWISDWVMLVQRYAGDDTVIGVDLHNEPRGRATWGSGDMATDWRLAAQRAGNAILKVNPHLLIVVQGVERYGNENYWWGGNLMGVREYPVQLDVPNQVVYSPHTYGPGVFPQTWFSDPRFPQNMPEIWDAHWGYVQREGIAPIIVGEFGGRSVKESDKEGVWQRALVDYLRENQISYLYWTINPNSGDTGGVLLDDWQSVDPQKAALLASYQFPLIGSQQAVGAGKALPPPPTGAQPSAAAPAIASTSLPGQPAPMNTSVPPVGLTATVTPQPTLPKEMIDGLMVRYHAANPSERSSDVKPEMIIANRSSVPVNLDQVELVYWFSDTPGQQYIFQCDWAQVGCDKITARFEPLADGIIALHVGSRGAGMLPPGQESGEIKLRFNHGDWSEMVQADDYSFSPNGAYQDWDRVGLLVNGQLVWGRPPQGSATAAPLPDTGSAPTLSPLAPTAIAQSAPPSEAARPTEMAQPVVPSANPAVEENSLGLGVVLAIVAMVATFVAGYGIGQWAKKK
jgi:endoglucanase